MYTQALENSPVDKHKAMHGDKGQADLLLKGKLESSPGKKLFQSEIREEEKKYK